MSHVYMGERDRPGNPCVYRDGITFSPVRSQQLMNHSPNGFEWGYGGSGPAQLALALLLDVCKHQGLALDYYQEFKWKVVAALPHSWWVISEREIAEWLAAAIDADKVDLKGVPGQ